MPVTDAGVDTLAFLEASEGLVGIFGAQNLAMLSYHLSNSFDASDLLGSSAFAVVQSDLKGNIAVRHNVSYPFGRLQTTITLESPRSIRCGAISVGDPGTVSRE